MKIAQIAPLMESVPPRLYGGTERVVSYLTEDLVAFGSFTRGGGRCELPRFSRDTACQRCKLAQGIEAAMEHPWMFGTSTPSKSAYTDVRGSTRIIPPRSARPRRAMSSQA